MILSSSDVHPPFLTSGLRWLCHLSLHCFPDLPPNASATVVHFDVPWMETRSFNFISSSLDQERFVDVGFLPAVPAPAVPTPAAELPALLVLPQLMEEETAWEEETILPLLSIMLVGMEDIAEVV